MQQALVGGQGGSGLEAQGGGHQGGPGQVLLDAVVGLWVGQVCHVLPEEGAGEGKREGTERPGGRGERAGERKTVIYIYIRQKMYIEV